MHMGLTECCFAGFVSSLTAPSPNLHPYVSVTPVPPLSVPFIRYKRYISKDFCHFYFQAEEVEEVEPYASYVQRVNSLYKSSVDVFTP